MDRKTRNEVLVNSDIINLIALNKNTCFIRQELYKQNGHELSYSIIKRYILEELKKTWDDSEKIWIDAKGEIIPAKPNTNPVVKSEESPKKTEITLEEIDKKLLAASYNLDSITKEEIINYLQTILKSNYTALSKIKRLEARTSNLEKKVLISKKTALINKSTKNK